MRPGDDDEPVLRVRPRPKPFFRRRRFLRAFIPAGGLGVLGLVALLVSGNLLLPFERLVTLEGKMGSKADFFEDTEVQEILLGHHLRVHFTRLGSRAAVSTDLGSSDFVFPSGEPAAQLVIQQRLATRRDYTVYRPFVSPIVLATYREYAETLRRSGVATPQHTPGADRPYYYDLDLTKFLDLTRHEKTWDQLGIAAFGLTNGNQVLVQTTDVCISNGSATYLGLVGYTVHGRAPTTEQEAVDLAAEIKPVLGAQGLPAAEPEVYFAPEGRGIVPIIAMYEHQYLEHQTKRSGRLDHDRVLLYPSVGFETQPAFVALTPDGDRLGRLLATDQQLRRRATELGYRVIDLRGGDSGGQLSQFLTERGVPVPAPSSDTRAVLPTVPLLEKMISIVGDCPPVR